MKKVPKRNLTLSLPADLIQAAKVLAARRGRSLNALVQDNLQNLVRTEEDAAAALRRILGTSFPHSAFQRKWNRSELYG